jgi:hypothetical protein
MGPFYPTPTLLIPALSYIPQFLMLIGFGGMLYLLEHLAEKRRAERLAIWQEQSRHDPTTPYFEVWEKRLPFLQRL